MVQGGCAAGFALKPLQGEVVFSIIVREKLERNITAEGCVLGSVRHSHSPAAEFFQYAIV
jgi:hypothetical protein